MNEIQECLDEGKEVSVEDIRWLMREVEIAKMRSANWKSFVDRMTFNYCEKHSGDNTPAFDEFTKMTEQRGATPTSTKSS